MAPSHKARKIAWAACALAACIVVPFAGRYVSYALNPDFVDKDALLLYVMSRFYDPELFPNDYAYHYILSQWMPVGYVALNRVWALFCDPVILHRLLRCTLYFACMPFVWFACKRVGGRVHAFAGLVLYATSIHFTWRMAGGMPHSFAFLLLWWGVWALLAGRARQLAACTVLSASLYPVITPVLGLMLAVWVLFPCLTTGKAQGALLSALRWQDKILWLAVPGICSFALIALFVWQGGADYGPSVEMSKDYITYPELADMPGLDPFHYILKCYDRAHLLLGERGAGVLSGVVFLLGLLGLVLMTVRGARARGLRPFFISAAICFGATFIFDWAVSYRYAIYTLPILLTFTLPVGLRYVCGLMPGRQWRGAYFTLALLLYAGICTQVVTAFTGYSFKLEPESKPLLNFIRSLPKNVLLAGWPDYSQLQFIPYLAQRQMLVMDFSYTLAHRKYILEMRRRMHVFNQAYFGKREAPLLTLRDEFGVDYLIINTEQLSTSEPPEYFTAFDKEIGTLWDEPGDFYVLSLYTKAGVFRDGPWQVLDLHKLSQPGMILGGILSDSERAYCGTIA